MPATLARSAAEVSDAPLGVPVVPEVNITSASSAGAGIRTPQSRTATSSPSEPRGVKIDDAPVVSARRRTSAGGTMWLADTTEHPAIHTACIATIDAGVLSSSITTRVPGVKSAATMRAADASEPKV
jgi:hypothetical protein